MKGKYIIFFSNAISQHFNGYNWTIKSDLPLPKDVWQHCALKNEDNTVFVTGGISQERVSEEIFLLKPDSSSYIT
jgi:hypothetical protein